MKRVVGAALEASAASVLRVPRLSRCRRWAKADGGWMGSTADRWAGADPEAAADKIVGVGNPLPRVQSQAEKMEKKKMEMLRSGQDVNLAVADPWAPAAASPSTPPPSARRAELRAQTKRREEARVAELGAEEVEAGTAHTAEDLERALDGAAEAVGDVDVLEWSSSGLYRGGGPSYIVELNEDNFEKEVEEEELPVIIDCWSPFCIDSVSATANLKMLVRRANAGPGPPKIKLCTLQCEDSLALANHLQISALPTALAVHRSEVLEHQAGLVDDEQNAQFVFGFVSAMHGDNALDHLKEADVVSRLIDARSALKVGDYDTALEKYTSAYSDANAELQRERAEREARRKAGEIIPEFSRQLSDAEVIAAKALAGQTVTLQNKGQYRYAKKALRVLEDEHKKAYLVLADVQKAASAADILMLSGFRMTDDVAELQDEERIDQHNLSIKAKLAGAYFMGGDFHLCLATCCILIRKNFQFMNNVGLHIAHRVFRYLGRHHRLVEQYKTTVEDCFRHRYEQSFMFNARVRRALNNPGDGGPLESEIPKMPSTGTFAVEKKSPSRHPLLR